MRKVRTVLYTAGLLVAVGAIILCLAVLNRDSREAAPPEPSAPPATIPHDSDEVGPTESVKGDTLPSIRGIVVDDATGAPVAGAQVAVFRVAPNAPCETFTDEDGRFALGNLSPDEPYLVSASDLASGTTARNPMAVTLKLGEDRRDVELRLAGACGLSGTVRVQRPEGNMPLPNAEVTVSTVAEPGGKRFRIADATTDEAGTYELSLLLPAQYMAQCVAPANTTEEGLMVQSDIMLESAKAHRNVDFLFHEGNVVYGTVTDPQYRGIPGAIVTLPSGRGYSVTDAQGHYRMAGMTSDVYQIIVDAEGYTMGIARYEGSPADFTLAPEGVVSGIVVDQQGSPVPQVTLRLKPVQLATGPGDMSLLYAIGKSQEDGTFTIKKAPEGEFVFYMGEDGKQREELADTVIRVAQGSHVKGVRVVLAGGEKAAISGIVVNAKGEPLPHSSVSATAQDGQGFQGCWTDEEGRFEFKLLQYGTYDIAAQNQDLGYAGASMECAAGTKDLRLVLPALATISGVVWDELDGGVIEGAELRVEHVELANGRKTQQISGDWSKTDSEGAFVLSYVYPGKISLQITHPDYMPALVEVTVGDGEQLKGLSVPISRGCSMEGYVTVTGLPDGMAVHSSNMLYNKATDINYGFTCDANGWYTASKLPSGPVRVKAMVDIAPSGEKLFSPIETVELNTRAVVRHDFVVPYSK